MTEPKATYHAVTGWRRFFTRTYWRAWWWARKRGRGGQVVSVGRLEIPPELQHLFEDEPRANERARPRLRRGER